MLGRDSSKSGRHLVVSHAENNMEDAGSLLLLKAFGCVIAEQDSLEHLVKRTGLTHRTEICGM
jgi:hypothetical protein